MRQRDAMSAAPTNSNTVGSAARKLHRKPIAARQPMRAATPSLNADGESFENPKYLDKLVETVGGEAATEYEQKVTCCGGALAFSEPEKSQKQIKDIVESAYDHGADMIVTPCPLCQANVEVYQSEINKKYGTKLAMPVAYYSQLMTVAYGGTLKQAGLDGHIIQPKKLQDIAVRVVTKK